MQPAWNKLEAQYAESTTVLIADVDCTSTGKPLCKKQNVRGYPTLKWGEPGQLKQYKGARDFPSLLAFVQHNLMPLLVCGPDRLELCAPEEREHLEELLNLTIDDLDAHIKVEQQRVQNATEEVEQSFQAESKKLQDALEALQHDKEEKVASILNDTTLLRMRNVMDKRRPPPSTTAAPSKKGGGSKENPLLYLRHLALYILLPIVCFIFLGLFLAPVIWRHKKGTKTMKKE